MTKELVVNEAFINTLRRYHPYQKLPEYKYQIGDSIEEFIQNNDVEPSGIVCYLEENATQKQHHNFLFECLKKNPTKIGSC